MSNRRHMRNIKKHCHQKITEQKYCYRADNNKYAAQYLLSAYFIVI